MRVAFFQSLPVRLAGLILVLSGLALLTLTEFHRRAGERILAEQAGIQSMLAANTVTEGLDAVAGSVERLARLVARDLEGRVIDATEAARIARNALLDQPQVHGFAIALEPATAEAERTGIAVYRSAGPTRYATLDLTTPDRAYWTRDWYRAVMERGQPTWSEPYHDREESDRDVVRLTVPIWKSVGEERTASGAVSVVLELDWLRRLANASDFADTGFTLVFSRSGRLVVHPREDHVIAETMDTLAERTNTPELAEIRRQVAARKQGAIIYTEPVTGSRVRADYKPARTAGWGVVVGYEESEFLRPQREFRRVAAGYLGASLLLLAGIVIGVTGRALRPLAGLARASDEIARGNLECEVPETSRNDEIGRLASAFRGMRDALKAQNLERRWAAQSLEHQLKYNQLVIDSIDELVFVLTKSLHVTRINPAVTRAAGYQAADIVRASALRVLTVSQAPGAEPLDAAALLEPLKAGQPRRGLHARLTAKSGAVLEGRLSLTPLTDENRVVGAVVTLRLDTPPAASA